MGRLGIEFEHAAYRYDDAPESLFTDLTCRLPEGWTGVVGPNGSGKTTLLRLATGAAEYLQHLTICTQMLDAVVTSIRHPHRAVRGYGNTIGRMKLSRLAAATVNWTSAPASRTVTPIDSYNHTRWA